MLFMQLTIGTIMIILTVIIHAFILDYIISNTGHWERKIFRRTRLFWKVAIISLVVLGVFAALITEIWVWAGLYLLLDVVSTLEEALYFSTVCFTTVGFGDIVLTEKWRMLSSIEAANGLFLFGWSTAFIFEIVTNLYRREGNKIKSD